MSRTEKKVNVAKWAIVGLVIGAATTPIRSALQTPEIFFNTSTEGILGNIAETAGGGLNRPGFVGGSTL
jgi:hypothetical protein